VREPTESSAHGSHTRLAPPESSAPAELPAQAASLKPACACGARTKMHVWQRLLVAKQRGTQIISLLASAVLCPMYSCVAARVEPLLMRKQSMVYTGLQRRSGRAEGMQEAVQNDMHAPITTNDQHCSRPTLSRAPCNSMLYISISP
jgi:hypothetical protein